MAVHSPASILGAKHLTTAYGSHIVCKDITVKFIPHAFTVILGPNGCGKSTLLKALSGTLTPVKGGVYFNDRGILSLSPKEYAKHVALLPQNPLIPQLMTVRDVVSKGRFPYQSFFTWNSKHDEEMIEYALHTADLQDISLEKMSDLSGGQRQRVWFALVLAQDTEIVLLDEPTTYLDISQQFTMLKRCKELVSQGRTVIAVLHDINHALRFADYILLMKDGVLMQYGAPREVITPMSLRSVFDINAEVHTDSIVQAPFLCVR